MKAANCKSGMTNLKSCPSGRPVQELPSCGDPPRSQKSSRAVWRIFWKRGIWRPASRRGALRMCRPICSDWKFLSWLQMQDLFQDRTRFSRPQSFTRCFSTKINNFKNDFSFQMRLYDPRAQRRPVKKIPFMENPIMCTSLTYKTNQILAANSIGEMGLFDLRSKVHPMCKFKGQAGSIRSITAHPTLPLAASVGIDRFLRVHDLQSRKLIHKVREMTIFGWKRRFSRTSSRFTWSFDFN